MRAAPYHPAQHIPAEIISPQRMVNIRGYKYMLPVDIVRIIGRNKRGKYSDKKEESHNDPSCHSQPVFTEPFPDQISKRVISHCLILPYLALILGSASIYPISASRLPSSVNIAPIVKMPMIKGIVPCHYAVIKQLPHTRDAEYIFEYHAAADQARD